MKIVALSDTHGKHRQYPDSWIPDGDVLMHCGDFTKHGRVNELEDFLDWFSQFSHEYKIFIAGNHDAIMTNHGNDGPPINARKEERIEELLNKYWFEEKIIYLHNSGKTIDGLTFYGSPYSNSPPGWYFNTRKEENQDVWEKVFDDTEILITHGPPYRINDKTRLSGHIGSEKLREKVEELPNLKVHLYGHNHGAHGESDKLENSYNCSVIDDNYEISNEPVVIQL